MGKTDGSGIKRLHVRHVGWDWPIRLPAERSKRPGGTGITQIWRFDADPCFTRPAGRFRRSRQPCRMVVKNNRPENRFSRLLARLTARPCLPWETQLIPGGGQSYDLLQTCRHRRPRRSVIQTHNGVLGPFTDGQALVKRLGISSALARESAKFKLGYCVNDLTCIANRYWPGKTR